MLNALRLNANFNCRFLDYELQLVNANPPVINMNKPPAMCALRPGAKVIFRILAIQ